MSAFKNAPFVTEIDFTFCVKLRSKNILNCVLVNDFTLVFSHFLPYQYCRLAFAKNVFLFFNNNWFEGDLEVDFLGKLYILPFNLTFTASILHSVCVMKMKTYLRRKSAKSVNIQ